MKKPCTTSAGSTVEAAFVHRGLEAREALGAGGLGRLALDEGDARMALRNQVQGHLARGVEVVDAHARNVFARAPGGQRHHRHASAAKAAAIAFDSHSGGGRITPAMPSESVARQLFRPRA